MNTIALLAVLACVGSEAPSAPEEAPPAPRAEAPPAAKGGLDLQGTIKGTPARGAKALFVSVKDASRPGPPIAAKKLDPSSFPVDFTLTEADILPMMKGRGVPAQVQLSVRLDGDGNATSREPGLPSKTQTVDADAHGLTISLD